MTGGAQTKNAMERMAATFVEGHPQPQGFGGEATTQDLVRLVLSGHIAYGQGVKRANTIVSEEDARAMTPGFLKSICTIMPNIMAVVTAEPDAAAMERAGAHRLQIGFHDCAGWCHKILVCWFVGNHITSRS